MARPTTRVSRVLMTGPVASCADAYRAELRERGYTPLSTVNELRQVARFSRWLQADGLTVAEVSDVRVEEFLAWQARRRVSASFVVATGLEVPA